MEKANEIDWAPYTLKEEPFWRDGMTVEEFEVERDYYLKNWHKWSYTQYIPLWRQNQNETERCTEDSRNRLCE